MKITLVTAPSSWKVPASERWTWLSQLYCHTVLHLIILAWHDKNTLKVWEGYLYWFSSYLILYVKGAFFRSKFRQHLVQTYQVLSKIDLKIQYFDVQNWITWELIETSFSNFQVIFVTTMGQYNEEKKGMAAQLSMPRPHFWGWYLSWISGHNECNFQIFLKNFFAC